MEKKKVVFKPVEEMTPEEIEELKKRLKAERERAKKIAEAYGIDTGPIEMKTSTKWF